MLRRFDIFAIYNYCKNLNKGMSEEKAKGDAIWVAKVVAGGSHGSAATVYKPTVEQKQAAHLNKVACQCECKKEAPVHADTPVDSCNMCGGPLMSLGQLGKLAHFKCRNCGAEEHRASPNLDNLQVLQGGWKELSGIPQTDKLYDREIIKKIGKDRYEKQVLPAVRAAVDAKQKYVDIRDTLRAELDKQEVK